MEDELFGKLGEEQKPREIPIDAILRITFAALFNSYFFIMMLRFPTASEDMWVPILVIYPIVWAYVLPPIRDYRDRRKAGLI